MLSRRLLLKSACAAALLPLVPPFVEKVGADGLEPQDPQWLQKIAEQLKEEFHLPAVWVAANIEDKVETAVVGVRKMGDPAPATVDDLLLVGSISKPMVAFWLATLVDAGKLSYETKVLDVLPELKEVCLPEHRDITLRELLTHTAGLIRDAKNFPNDIKLEQYPAERIRQAKYVLSMPSPPNSRGKELYSNQGLTLAASIGEKVAGEAYEVAAGRFFCERLGLSSWGIWPMDAPVDPLQPWPHHIQGATPVAVPRRMLVYYPPRSSGSAHCTIGDLVRFGLLATEATAKAESLLKPATWDVIGDALPNTRRTLGSFELNNEKSSYEHSGSLITAISNLLVIPEWKVAVAMHTNAKVSTPDFSKRGAELISSAIRKRRAQLHPPAPCRVVITGVDTTDATWQQVIVPKSSDDKVRIRIRFRVEAPVSTGDLQMLVKVGDVERRDNRYRGLKAGGHTFRFSFDVPKDKVVPVVVQLDTLGTSGNRDTEAARVETTLTIQ